MGHPGRLIITALAAAACPGLMGCDTNSPRYYQPAGPLEVGGTDQPAAITDLLEIPFRAPTAAEMAALDAESMRLGYPVPWLRQKDLALSIVYTVKNLDRRAGVVQMLVNGADEFTNYDVEAIRAALMMQLPQEDVIVLPLIQAIPATIEPGQTLSGVIREDDFSEAALDLDAIGRWMATPAAVLVNRSEVSRTGLEEVPANHIVPAFFRVAITLAADVHMRVEYLVRVRGPSDRLLKGGGAAFQPMPLDYVPMPVP